VTVDGEVLVSIEHDDGVAGILRYGELACLSGYLGDGGTVLDGYWSSMEGLTGERSAEGGLLPPGAVGAEVVDRSGRRHRAASATGAWLIVLNEATIGDARPVRFLDPERNTVRRPVPVGWAREPQSDFHEPCPACGDHNWERILAPDGSGGMRRVAGEALEEPPETVPEVGGDWEATPWLACTTCGHAETEGITFSAMVKLDDVPPEGGRPTSG
jgi:hypothetical protein